ncbi:MAG: MltR family transcriptional regulator [Solidesulfovibrio sp. DCME]|uniref:MltR family transcriptional regulator n=1 Tax=Solidesulfovibrio sp. DCME TaxID=3447380 RepID=UPI003D0AAB9E
MGEPNLINESDRGIFIVAAAYIENILDNILKSQINKINPSKEFVKNLFDLSGPLSSFSSKSAICHAFGLISKESYSDICIIRKIRNIVAHCYNEIDISSCEIESRILSLSCVKPAVNSFKGKRYSLKTQSSKTTSTEEPGKTGLSGKKREEYHARLNGYVKYHKSIFALGVQRLAYNIEFESYDPTDKQRSKIIEKKPSI